MRIVDGPDEVHLLQVGRREVKERTAAGLAAASTVKATTSSTLARTGGISGKAGAILALKENMEKESGRERNSARQMGAEKDGESSVAPATGTFVPVASARTESETETETGGNGITNRGTDIYDVKTKLEAQRRKSVELGKRYGLDVLRDPLDVEQLKNEQMERRRSSRSGGRTEKAKL